MVGDIFTGLGAIALFALILMVIDLDRWRSVIVPLLIVVLLLAMLARCAGVEASPSRQIALEAQRCYAEDMRAVFVHGRIECRE